MPDTPSSASDRRRALLVILQNRGNLDADCIGCSAPCCSYKHNRMQLSLEEAAAVFIAFGRISLEQMRETFRKTINDYGLKRSVQWKNTYVLRKSYTCPFFSGEELGCQVPYTFKPFGCLAFNPLVSAQTEGGECIIDADSVRQAQKGTTSINLKLQKLLQIYWQSAPIPIAILDVLDAYSHLGSEEIKLFQKFLQKPASARSAKSL